MVQEVNVTVFSKAHEPKNGRIISLESALNGIRTGGKVKETILDFILYKDIDILTTITHKRSFFEGLFDSSFTKKIAKEVSVPVLVMHET